MVRRQVFWTDDREENNNGLKLQRRTLRKITRSKKAKAFYLPKTRCFFWSLSTEWIFPSITTTTMKISSMGNSGKSIRPVVFSAYWSKAESFTCTMIHKFWIIMWNLCSSEIFNFLKTDDYYFCQCPNTSVPWNFSNIAFESNLVLETFSIRKIRPVAFFD